VYMRTVVINSSNYVSGNTFAYNFPSAVMFGKGDEVAVAGLAVFNSTFNITAARGNNQVTLSFPQWASFYNPSTVNFTWSMVNTTFTVTFPDGYYTIPQINSFLQQQMLAQGVTGGNAASPVYYINITQVTSSLTVQIQISDIPPPGASSGAPQTKTTPTMTFNAAFGTLLGFPASSLSANSVLASTSNVTSYFYYNSLPVQINPINSYTLTCNLLNGIHQNPPNILYTVPLSAPLGNFIVVSPSQFLFNAIAPNVYSQIIIRIFDQNFNPITLLDTEMVLMLVIREA